jgi:hypothetical protein
MENDFRYFMDCLENAAAMMTNPHYFRLPVLNMETPEFRERVYCYELYHQLRTTISPNWPYELDGEVDKAGYPNGNVRDKKPDLIIHAPGTNNNLAVVEVKAIKNASGPCAIRSGLKKDLDTINTFIETLRYYRGIILLYGDGDCDLPRPVLDKANEYNQGQNNIIFLWHPGPSKQLKFLCNHLR